MKKVCTYCVMDNESDNTIVFDINGQCNYCNDAIKRMPKEYFPNEVGREKLDAIMKEIKVKTTNDAYSCMVGVSGGVDSSYILYLGYKYDLKMLAVHIDDGLDTEIAKQNINRLCEKTGAKLINIKPHAEEYKDILMAFLKSGVPGIAIPQDNILSKELSILAKKFDIKYSLSGVNFALESILERSTGVNANDSTHIKAIHNKYGNLKLKNIKLQTLLNAYITKKYFSKTKIVTPLNLIDYNLEKALVELNEFCGYVYYGGKHYESILTRFLQCYYLPIKFNQDKRKSHFSSMIVSNQLSREDALKRLQKNEYIESGLYKKDLDFLSKYFNVEIIELERIIKLPPKSHNDYKTSILNHLAPIARKCRRFLG